MDIFLLSAWLGSEKSKANKQPKSNQPNNSNKTHNILGSGKIISHAGKLCHKEENRLVYFKVVAISLPHARPRGHFFPVCTQEPASEKVTKCGAAVTAAWEFAFYLFFLKLSKLPTYSSNL